MSVLCIFCISLLALVVLVGLFILGLECVSYYFDIKKLKVKRKFSERLLETESPIEREKIRIEWDELREKKWWLR